MKKYVVIVAGGTGTRMQSAIPKQFLLLSGKPVLMHTMEIFYKSVPEAVLINVIPSLHFGLWEQLCHDFNFTVPHILVPGGEKRSDSVKNGLAHIGNEGIVAIHDAVRPLISPEVIRNCFETAGKNGTAIPVIPLKDSVRRIIGDTSCNEDRSTLRAVQTPQCFRCELIKDAYANAPAGLYTDDASVAEACEHTVTLTEGHEDNIKITSPTDLLIAEILIKSRHSV
ncbi:MAG: 2-C-methyl-D-erythritol 4-phosphate cytidylyltransferase 1 [Bacteroidetes bacterium ADurb.Bin408]|nr:MAG: 2-C-methyl-D-erythritol 4-phosphate cytidylyltransferase 1 [Bacteroidetes bacterium ADurb.Bin408]